MGLKFKSFTEVEYLICEYTSCDYCTWSSKSNEIEWHGITNHYYSLDLGLGVIITLSSDIASNEKISNITHCNFPSYVCFHYEIMNNTSIGKRYMYINCKYLYYIFCYLCKLDYKKVMFIHAFTFNWDEIKQMFVTARIIKTCEWVS